MTCQHFGGKKTEKANVEKHLGSTCKCLVSLDLVVSIYLSDKEVSVYISDVMSHILSTRFIFDVTDEHCVCDHLKNAARTLSDFLVKVVC